MQGVLAVVHSTGAEEFWGFGRVSKGNVVYIIAHSCLMM